MAVDSREAYRASSRWTWLKRTGESAGAVAVGGYDHDFGEAYRRNRDGHTVIGGKVVTHAARLAEVLGVQ